MNPGRQYFQIKIHSKPPHLIPRCAHLPPEQPCGQRQAWYTRCRMVPFCTWQVTVLVTVCGHQFLQGKSTNTVETQGHSADDLRLKVLVTSSPACGILAPPFLLLSIPLPFVLQELYGVYTLLISHAILPGVHCRLCLFCSHSSADKHPFALSSRWGGEGGGGLGRG